MEESSSEGSEDEEEILRYFDEEAKIIVQTETMPTKSTDRYLLVYNTYKKWREENKNSLSNSEENNLIVYFEALKPKLKPPTLWSIWSMLKKTLNVMDNININNFFNLKSLIKSNGKGYKPKKARVLRWNEIIKFMNDAPDIVYLATKVILIFGMCGCLRCDEISNMKVDDVEDLGDKYLVSIAINKNDYAGQFIIGNLFYDKVKNYISLRPTDRFSDKFFIQYKDGKCFRQNIGRHKIGEVPFKIASFLQLPNVEKYTGHSLRRSSATLLSDSGANMQMIKQLGRWRSDIIAQGYIENSMHNRQMIYNGVIQNTKTLSSTYSRPSASSIHPMPSTSSLVIDQTEKDISDQLNVNWEDFEEDFHLTDTNQIPTNNNQIPLPALNKKKSDVTDGSMFYHKPGIKLKFKNHLSDQPSACRKRKINEDSDNQKNIDMNSTLKKHELRFDNCTFNNCVFNVNADDNNNNCNKENDS